MSAKIPVTVEFEVRIATGYPLPYHELVGKTQASDDGDMARVGLAINLAVLYVWINDVMHIVRMEDVINGLIPHLLPERVRLTESGRAALAEYRSEKARAAR